MHIKVSEHIATKREKIYKSRSLMSDSADKYSITFNFRFKLYSTRKKFIQNFTKCYFKTMILSPWLHKRNTSHISLRKDKRRIRTYGISLLFIFEDISSNFDENRTTWKLSNFVIDQTLIFLPDSYLSFINFKTFCNLLIKASGSILLFLSWRTRNWLIYTVPLFFRNIIHLFLYYSFRINSF